VRESRWIGWASACLSSALCWAGGVWLLTLGIGDDEGGFFIALGLYFVGKGFFVGPMLGLALRDRS